MVINDVRIYPGGLVSVSCKYINIFSKKIYQLLPFPRRHLNSDLKELLFIIAKTTFSSCSHFAASATTPADNTNTFDYYKSRLAEVEDSPPILCLIVVAKNFLVIN